MVKKSFLIVLFIFLLVTPLVFSATGELVASTNRNTDNNPNAPEIYDPVGTACATTSELAKDYGVKFFEQDRFGSDGKGRKHCYVTDLLEEYNDLNYIKGKGKGLGEIRECTGGKRDGEFYNVPPIFISWFDGLPYFTHRGYELAHAECQRDSGGYPVAHCQKFKCHYCAAEGENNPTCKLKAKSYFPDNNPDLVPNLCKQGKYNGQRKSCYFCAPIAGTGRVPINIMILDGGSDTNANTLIRDLTSIQPYKYLHENNYFTFYEIKGEVPGFKDYVKINLPAEFSQVATQRTYGDAHKLMEETCQNNGINMIVDKDFLVESRAGAALWDNECNPIEMVVSTDPLSAAHELGHHICQLADEYWFPNQCNTPPTPDEDPKFESKKALNIDFKVNKICPKFNKFMKNSKCFFIPINVNVLRPGTHDHDLNEERGLPYVSTQTSLMGLGKKFNRMSCFGCMRAMNVPEDIAKDKCFNDWVGVLQPQEFYS